MSAECNRTHCQRPSDAANLPAYVIFRESTLKAIAQIAAQNMQPLASISGIGERKLQACGERLLELVQCV
jgi:superfamily II DNA helicase RecQ